MAGVERKVRAVVTSYIHPDGAPRIGLRGEEITVHEDHVGAFDKGEAEVPELKSDAVDPSGVIDTTEEPPRSGRGSGVEAWTTYAEGLGIVVPEGASRDDVIALVNDDLK